MRHCRLAAPLLLCLVAVTPKPPNAAEPTTKPVVPETGLPNSADAAGTETVVFFRHGEKPAGGLGQLTPQGLNRALALATLLPQRYGRPDFLYAPDPAATKVSEGGSTYYYCRPLATIEPTAIALGMPIQTPYGFAQIDKLNAELTQPKFARSTIFVAWEHGYEQRAAENLVRQFGGDPKQVPHWHGSDYDSLYVVRLRREPGRAPVVTFTHEQEGLDGKLAKTMPAAVVAPAGDPPGR